MSTAPAAVVEQAQRLVRTARLLLADECAKVLDPAAIRRRLSTTTHDTGRWGWTGQDAAPPPGHAPPGVRERGVGTPASAGHPKS